MRSKTDGKRRMHKLATRVVVSTMVAGALAGALAALSAVLAVDHMIARHAEQRVAGAADVLAGELDEGFEEGAWEPLSEIVDDENGELITSGIRLAVYSGGHRIAGDPWTPSVPGGTCATKGAVGARVIACGRGYRDWVLVSASHSDQHALRAIYASAGLSSLALGAAIAALSAWRFSRWALAPMAALSRSIRRLQPDASDSTRLGPASDCEEVELIRDALVDLQARVRALLDQARRFSADAAHELRTPLATIRAEVELLREEAQGERDRAALERIGGRVEQLGALVERLLALSSVLGPREVLVETVSLADLTDEVVARLPVAQRQRVQIDAPDEAPVRGDPDLLRSLISNALDNALKFSGTERVMVRIDEQEDAGQRWVRFEARDRGPGVPQALRKRVFEPFFRADANAAPGHGLGLALIGHIAEAHGGRAEILDDDATDPGATLRVLLPPWRPRDPNES
jgi:signal transduction histidine kinase